MELEEFVLDMHEKVQEFRSFWLTMYEKEPENYPLEMNSGDWYEQFFHSLY